MDASTTFSTLINAVTTAGGPTYQFRQINPENNQDGGEPGGNIRVGFLFNPNRVTFVDRPGGTATSATTINTVGGQPQLSFSPGRVDPANPAFSGDGANSASRKPLAGEFLFNGQTVFVIGNHFSSKGGDDPLFGDVQPPVLSSETQRNQQATVVRDFVRSILSVNANANVIVAGDLNDFEFSNPLNTLKATPLTALIETLPTNERYTYNFEGNAQTLDHILVSNNLTGSRLDGYDVVHFNSEFSDQDSDHDPSVARFNLAPMSPLSVTATASPDNFLTTGNSRISAIISGGTSPYRTLIVTGPGTIWPNIGFATVFDVPAGVQTFTVTVTDFASQTATGTVSVTVTQANRPPVAVNPIANQTATVGQPFSVSIPDTTFIDPDGDPIFLAPGPLPPGLSFDGSSTINGTPLQAGVSRIDFFAYDTGSFGLTSFTLTVNPASTTPPTPPFAITGVTTVSCDTVTAGERRLTFTPQYSGLSGQPVSFSVVSELNPTTSPGPYTLRLYTDNPVITLKATQSGTSGEASFAYNWLAACNGGGTPPANQPPVVVNNIPDQTATANQDFSYLIPANTFSDPNGDALTLSVSGLPSGLSFNGSTISGMTSMLGTSTVTVTATDPGGLSVSDQFTLSVNPAPVLPLSVTVTAVPDKFRTNESLYLSIVIAGGTTPYRLVSITGPGRIYSGFYTVLDVPVGVQTFTVTVADDAGQTASGTVSVTVTEPASTTTAPTTTGIANQTATVDQAFSLDVAPFFSDAETPNSLTFSAMGLPNGLITSGSTIIGTPTGTAISTITVRATDPGGLSVSAQFTLTVNPASTTPPTPPFAITGVTTVSCETVTAGERRLTFTPQYSGLSGQPVSFSVANELNPTTTAGPYTLRLYTDNPVITLKATQSGTVGEASFTYNWLAVCNGGSGRIGVGLSTESLLDVRILGNPAQHGQVSVEVRGAAGQPLRVSLTDLRGQVIGSHQVEQAYLVEQHTFSIGRQSAGVLLLRATTPTQVQTVKVIKPD